MEVKRYSDSVIIVLHEIYGLNDHVSKVCNHLQSIGFNTICPNLLNQNEPFLYKEEREAYKYFMDNIGFELASSKVKEVICQAKKDYSHVFLLGFSIGATIAWLCSSEENQCDGMIGYYGSRIRDYINITPKCPTLLIFAAEDTFSADSLASELKKKVNSEVYVLPGKHGFSNSFSKNYSKQSSEAAEKLVENFLKEKTLRMV